MVESETVSFRLICLKQWAERLVSTMSMWTPVFDLKSTNWTPNGLKKSSVVRGQFIALSNPLKIQEITCYTTCSIWLSQVDTPINLLGNIKNPELPRSAFWHETYPPHYSSHPTCYLDVQKSQRTPCDGNGREDHGCSGRLL